MNQEAVKAGNKVVTKGIAGIHAHKDASVQRTEQDLILGFKTQNQKKSGIKPDM